MSKPALEGKVGAWTLKWLEAPRGRAGESEVEAVGADGKPQRLRVRWRMDDHGIAIETPTASRGFSLHREIADDGQSSWTVSERDSGRAWGGLRFQRAGEAAAGGSAQGKAKSVRVRAQMPGKIVRVHIEPGATVTKGQAVLVMEAMKMENEIKASQAGTVSKIAVTQGQAVESGADLFVIDP